MQLIRGQDKMPINVDNESGVHVAVVTKPAAPANKSDHINSSSNGNNTDLKARPSLMQAE